MIMLNKNISPLFKYLLYSILVTLLDVVIVWILYRPFHINIVISNTVGVIVGFIIHYLLASKSVFDMEYGGIGFIIYLGTFLFGLVLANGLIYVGESYLFKAMPVDINFLFSKGLSIFIPFFVLYYLRMILYKLFNSTKSKGNVYGND